MYEKDCVARKNRLRSDLTYFVFANDFIWFCNSLFEGLISQWSNNRPYKDDVSVPVFLRRKSAFSCKEIAKILLRKYYKEQMCLSQPINVSNNVSFLLDHSKI